MKAVRIHSFGGPEKVRYEDVPIPHARANEALVKIKATGVNPVDWMIRERIYNPEGAEQVPLTLGQDFSGVIEKIGEGTDQQTELRVGDEVIGETWGSFAEYAAVPIQDLIKKPKSIDFETAAAI